MSVWEDVLEKNENVDADANATRIIGVGMVSSYPRQEGCVSFPTSYLKSSFCMTLSTVACPCTIPGGKGKGKTTHTSVKSCETKGLTFLL